MQIAKKVVFLYLKLQTFIVHFFCFILSFPFEHVYAGT